MHLLQPLHSEIYVVFVACILPSHVGVSNSTNDPTHPQPDYSGSRQRVFLSKIWFGRFSLESSPQNPKKPEPTKIHNIFRQNFLDSVKSQLNPWNLHRIWWDLFIYGHIQQQYSGFCSIKAHIRWKYVGFCSNLAKLRWVLLKSRDDLIFLLRSRDRKSVV